jgi:hypothetical protein
VNETILTIRNSHIEECGTPPKLGTAVKEGTWTCYFENHHGEQFVMQYDTATDTCRLWSGDVGWEEPLLVEEFHGRVLVRFARNRAERAAEFRMNKQFEWQHEGTAAADTSELQRARDHVLRNMFGRLRLTDAECEYVSDGPLLTREERGVIEAYWRICEQLRPRPGRP